MNGGRDLLTSERGTWCIVLAVIALVLVVLEYITGSEWVSFMQWITTALLAAKTADYITDRRAQSAAPGATT